MKQKITLFYLDDDTDDLEFFKEVADIMDVSVILFNTGNALIERLHNPPPMPAIVFLDLNMPIKSGYEIISEIKESSEFLLLPLVVFSTASERSIVEKCKKLGASLYMRKATSIKEMKTAIEFAMGVDWKNFDPDGSKFLYRY
jgi:response regulator RpfG family c-di-GMP phosphodiesterase